MFCLPDLAVSGYNPGVQQRWSEQQYYYPPVTDVVLRLMGLLIAAFAVQWLAASLFYPHGMRGIVADNGLQFSAAFHPAQLLTHFLLSPGAGFIYALLGLALDCLFLYMFGAELERAWGRHNFLRFVWIGLAGGVAAGALTSLIPVSLVPGNLYYGIDAGIAAMLTAYAILWPERQALFFFVIPVRMKWIVPLTLILLGLLGGTMRVILYCGGALAAALFLYYHARRGRNYSVMSESSLTTASGSAASPGLRERWQEALRQRRMNQKRKEWEKRQAEYEAKERSRVEMQSEVDRLLEKISKEGMQSLSRKEKAFLDKASKEI